MLGPPALPQGHVYVGVPPLYKLDVGRRAQYCYTEEELKAALAELAPCSYTMQRFKVGSAAERATGHGAYRATGGGRACCQPPGCVALSMHGRAAALSRCACFGGLPSHFAGRCPFAAGPDACVACAVACALGPCRVWAR